MNFNGKMKVVILAGGLGTRLREETEFKPKPMVEIGEMPILWHIMKIYSHYGHKEFILPLGYKGDTIKQFFVEFKWRGNDFSLNLRDKQIQTYNNHNLDDWNIHFINTGLKTKTALRLYKVKHLLENEENFMLTYGDAVADVDINKLIEFHKKQNTIVTITGVRILSKFGVLETKNNKVTLFAEKPADKNFINGGFMVFNKKIFDYINTDDVMIVQTILPKLAKMGEVSMFHHDKFWHCMDTYRDYLELNKLWKNGPKWKLWK